MKTAIKVLLLPLLAVALPAQRPWQQITVPSVRDVAADFKAPPHEYGAIQPFMSWNGPGAKERMARIVQDLDRLSANGIFIVNMSPGRGEPAYLSPEHINQVKFVVREAAKRGMKLWIQDEYDYPSGFAGGKISEQYPQLTMQGLDADIRITVMPGQTLKMPTPPDTLGALAVFAQTGATQLVPIGASGINWRAPAITRTGLERFRAFVKAGGKLIFVGQTPKLVVDKTFLDAAKDAVPDLSFATLIEPSGDITERVIAALPKPDVVLDSAWQRLTYTHRSWRDAEMYFFFNEGNQEQSRTATVAGRGQAQVWDLGTGEIHPISGATAENDSVRFSLVLGPYETKVVVVGPLPSGVAAPEPSLVSGNTLADLGGDWTLDLNGKQVTTPLKSWEELGTASFAGPATYRKQFTISAAPAGKRLFLEIADVHEYAKVKVNGTELEGHAWQAYRWDGTNVVKPGANDLEVEVRTSGGGRGGFDAPPPPTAAAPGSPVAGGRGGRGQTA